MYRLIDVERGFVSRFGIRTFYRQQARISGVKILYSGEYSTHALRDVSML